MIPNLLEIIEDIEQNYLNGNITDAKATLFTLPAELAAAVGASAICIPATRFTDWALEYVEELKMFEKHKVESKEKVVSDE